MPNKSRVTASSLAAELMEVENAVKHAEKRTRKDGLRELQYIFNVLMQQKVIKWYPKSDTYRVKGTDPFYIEDSVWKKHQSNYNRAQKRLDKLKVRKYNG